MQTRNIVLLVLAAGSILSCKGRGALSNVADAQTAPATAATSATLTELQNCTPKGAAASNKQQWALFIGDGSAGQGAVVLYTNSAGKRVVIVNAPLTNNDDGSGTVTFTPSDPGAVPMTWTMTSPEDPAPHSEITTGGKTITLACNIVILQ